MPSPIVILNLIVALSIVATIIVYASIIIPIALTCFAGFLLLLWIVSHTADALDIAWRRLRAVLKRFTRELH